MGRSIAHYSTPFNQSINSKWHVPLNCIRTELFLVTKEANKWTFDLVYPTSQRKQERDLKNMGNTPCVVNLAIERERRALVKKWLKKEEVFFSRTLDLLLLI